ncbi:MAG: hypothetical protein IT393_06745 [Nitrospirae bacterium]|nr:hypothetical protein [Nitrospirota bacterium]
MYPLFFVLFVFETLSGIYLYLDGSFTVSRQFTGLTHIIIGLLALLPAIAYQTLHIVRSIRSPRHLMRNLGILAFVTLVASLVTGVMWGYEGTRADNYVLTGVHLIASIAALVLILMHISVYIGTRREWRLFNTFLPKSNLVFSLAMIAVILALSNHYKPMEYKNGTPDGYVLKWNDNPFYPSESMTSTGGIIDARIMGNSKSCGVAGCHTDIYRQWYSSAHRWSSTDVFYRATEKLMVKKEGMIATRYCGGCHDPIALFAGDQNPGKSLDTPYSEEGISCIVCHSITQITHMRGSGSYLFTPPSRYIYEGKDGYLPELVSNLAISSNPAKHRDTYSKDFYEKPEYCVPCHKQFIGKDTNHWGWLKLQDQYSSWLASRFSGRNSKGFFSEKDQKTCNDCHMPLVKSDDPAAGPDGMVRSHRYVAANTAVPWLTGDKEQLELTEEWLKRREVFLDIYEPRIKDGPRETKFISQDLYHAAEITPWVYMGDKFELQISVTNFGVGHHFPDGPVDIHEAWIEVRITDSAGNLVFSSGAMDKNGEVDEKAHFYRALEVDRYGKIVDKHNLWDMIGHVYVKMIPPGETDIATYEVEVPYWVKGNLTVMARLRYRKFNQQYTNWALNRTDVRLPIVDMARDSITIPVRNKREQERGLE